MLGAGTYEVTDSAEHTGQLLEGYRLGWCHAAGQYPNAHPSSGFPDSDGWIARHWAGAASRDRDCLGACPRFGFFCGCRAATLAAHLAHFAHIPSVPPRLSPQSLLRTPMLRSHVLRLQYRMSRWVSGVRWTCTGGNRKG